MWFVIIIIVYASACGTFTVKLIYFDYNKGIWILKKLYNINWDKDQE